MRGLNRSLLHVAIAATLLVAGLCGLLAPGRAFAQAPRPIDRATRTAGPDGNPLSAEDYRELEQMEKAISDFEAASRDYRGTVSHIVKQEYDRKRRELLARYDGQIRKNEVEEKNRRNDAIVLFERWLKKYPNDRRWTPDVIFRLAELYFERSNEEYLAAVDTAQKAAEAAQKAGKESTMSAPVTPDYSRTIALYKRLIVEFPKYRLIDGAYYLLGYCMGEMNQEPEARQAFLALSCTNKHRALDPPAPPRPSRGRHTGSVDDPYKDCKPISEQSRFVPEAWTRIGEYHFDANELELAIYAYARVLKYKESPYFDKALYKLAWSYYRADKYPEAIRNFDDLIKFSDARKSESGKEGSDLRSEAVQYLGISFAEKDWNADGADDYPSPNPSDALPARERAAKVQALARIEEFYKGREAEPHVRDIFKKLGDIYYDETEYVQAIAVYKRLLEKWPYASDAPKTQDRVVLVYEKMREFDKVLEETGALVSTYAPGGDWDRHNRDKPDAIKERNELREARLVNFAVNHHKAAQQYKTMAFKTNPPDGAMLQKALKEYAFAAQGYSDYLKTFPNSKNTYEYTFYYAESLYWGQKFADAAEAYEKVRDSNLDNRFLEDAAFNAVKSYENLVDKDTKEGKLKIPDKPEVGKVPEPVQAIVMPDEMRKLQTAYDSFATKVPNSGKVPVMQYKAAEMDFRYLDFEKMRPRMEKLLEKFCKGNEIGGEAGSAILASYSIEKNLEKIIEWGERLQKDQCGVPKPGAAIASSVAIAQTIADARFLKAQKAFDAGQFESAAEQFIKIVDGDPKDKGGNNDKALYNAAVGFEKVNRPGSATKVYERIIAEYPTSKFVDDALFRTAVTYQHAFEFDRAVGSYQRLATEDRFKESSHRTDALFNAAVILENDQNYTKAAELFLKWTKDPKVARKDAGDAVFRAAQIYQKNQDPKRAISVFGDYLKNYKDDPKKVIEAEFHIAEAYEALKQKALALKQYVKIVEEGATVPPASDAAEYPARAAFILAEQELPKLEKMKMSGDPKKLDKELNEFLTEIRILQDMYNRAIAYKRITWALAGFYRIGYIEELLSRQLGSVANAPCPKDIMKKYKQEGCDIYLQQLAEAIEKKVQPVDEEVVKRYRVTLEQGAKLGAANEWTRQARIRAHTYKPEEFPLTKDELIQFQLEEPK